MGTVTGYYTAVQKILSRVTANTMRAFSEQASDEQRVAFVLGLDYVGEAFAVSIKPSGCAKSGAESKKLREKGNQYYQRKQYKDALELYNNSLLLAPFDNEDGGGGGGGVANGMESSSADELVLALGNRSATLYQLRSYRQCLADIDVALLHAYPDHLLYKIYDRKGRCHMELGQVSEAKDAFMKVKDVLPSARLDDKKKSTILANTEARIKNLCGGQERPGKPAAINNNDVSPSRFSEDLPAVAVPSERYPGASRAFEVKFSPDRGRYSVATCDVNVGDVILLDQPYCGVLDSRQYGRRCYHCMDRLNSPFYCHQCTRVQYCSEECRLSSWRGYHEEECPYLALLLSSGTGNIAHLALRVLLQTGLDRVWKCKRNPKSDQADAQTSLFTDSNGVYMGGYIAVYNFVQHTSKRSKNDLLQYTILAVFLLEILQQTTFFSRRRRRCSDEVDDLKLGHVVGGIVLHFLQVLSCNAYEVMQTKMGVNLQRCEPDVIGLAVYPTLSLVNHSCDPNMELVFYKNMAVLRAMRSVARGAELNIDYGFLFYTTPKAQRQLSLSAQYFFECKCTACAMNWGLKSQLKSDIPVLKCVACAAPLGLQTAQGETNGSDPSRQTCRKCKTLQNPLQLFERLQKSATLMEAALDQARSWQLTKALPMLEYHLTLLDKSIVLPWKDYVTCLSMIKQCYRVMGNKDRQIVLVK